MYNFFKLLIITKYEEMSTPDPGLYKSLFDIQIDVFFFLNKTQKINNNYFLVRT